VGSEVSFNELSVTLGVDTKTVQRYLDLLEKAFVIFRLGGFSRNLRQEITRKSKYYFYDNGIRNALIAQFNRLDQRSDAGPLWENFFFIERMKYRAYTHIFANTYFWRTYGQQEIDLVEERDGRLFGFEAKWSVKKTVYAPRLWQETYPESEYHVVTPDNYFELVS
jgi:predicted AAA+ superfamily ATPase